MSTNALISYYEHDRVHSVYIHWDGNPAETGKKLCKFFPTKSDAKALIQVATYHRSTKMVFLFIIQNILHRDCWRTSNTKYTKIMSVLI